MIGLSLEKNENGIPDIHFNNGILELCYDSKAVGQHVGQRISTFKGEWFLDTDCGVDYIGEVFGNRYDPELYENILKKEIIDTYGVFEITSFSVSFNKEKREIMGYDITVITDESEAVTI